MTFNPITYLYDFFFTLADMVSFLASFLFTQITIGTWTFTPIIALGGGMIITLLIAKLIKEFVPLI